MKKTGCFVALGIFLFVVVLPAAIWLYLFSRDIAPIDDSDLLFEYIPAGPETNGFQRLADAAEAIDLNVGDAPFVDRLFDSGGDWTTAEDPTVAALLERNRTAIDLFLSARDFERIQAPEITLPSDLVPHLAYWLSLSRLASIQARSDARAGRESVAAETAMAIIEIGGQMADSDGGVLNLLYGTDVMNIGLAVLVEIVVESDFSAVVLRNLARRLESSHFDHDVIKNILAWEYSFDVSQLNQLQDSGIAAGLDEIEWMLAVPGFYKPNVTRQKFLDNFRIAVANLAVPVSQALPSNNEYPKPETMRNGNAYGEVVYVFMLPALDSHNIPIQTVANTIDLAQLSLLLKAYSLERDRLPESLSALVPDYIDALPADRMDGLPFRYLPAKRMIYSIGPDLVDQGGRPRDYDEEAKKTPIVPGTFFTPSVMPEKIDDVTYYLDFE